MNFLRRPQVILMLLALVLLAVTVFKPTLELERSTYRYVFVYDISQSMNVMDIPKTDSSISRLEFAKQSTLHALDQLPCGTEAGLALFTGHRAFLLIEPIDVCANYREFAAILNNINWRMTWKARSEIAKGIHKSISLMQAISSDTRVIFMTDGHESPPINPEVSPRFRGEIGEVKGLIVGVGGDQLVPIPKFDKKTGEPQGVWKADEVDQVSEYAQSSDNLTGGTEHLSSLREAYLQGIAEKTGLQYHRLIDADDLADKMKTADLSNPKIITTDIRWVFALAALLTFIATLLIDPARKYFR